jgi:DNA-binding MarR family transcriptional regulator
MSRADVETVLRCYPQIYFACHRRHVRDEKTGQVMSQNQASILDHLDDTEGTALFDLARHMGVTASTMSLTVDRLERGGWVKRERSKQDARRVELRLVDAMLARLEDGKRKKALRGLELLAEASRELVESGEMTRILRGVA